MGASVSQRYAAIALVAYCAASAVCLAASLFLTTLPTEFAPYLFTVLGPPAWLLWGTGSVPFFVAATVVLGFVAGAATLVIRNSRSPLAMRVTLGVGVVVWLLNGWVAWAGAF